MGRMPCSTDCLSELSDVSLFQTIFFSVEVTIVDLDTGIISNNFQSQFPEGMKTEMIKRLRNVLYPQISSLDSAFGANVPSWACQPEEEPSSSCLPENEGIRSVFLWAFVSLFHNYKPCIQILRYPTIFFCLMPPYRKYPKPVFTFDRYRFLRGQLLEYHVL